ncbi:Major Facilitator Superfamily protein [Rathayibacter oskolensis]|uniref:Major Facilitator Superfamily protein n=1 Tax=Rathayibacter oskolensis TaxID=1891671 RepID=A0A1X7MTX8_9MICO|nr:MFS transporter [Rathayibacter oskolensis]SMH28280.1 Major Facilitator Superfamily protein [Rathayibacter oskolensis]
MTAGTAVREAPPSLRGARWPLAGLMIAQFVAGLSATIVATSVPTVMRSLEGAAGLSTWLVAATILGNTATTPLWGRLADLVAPKRILQCAIGLFIAGSVLAALAPTTAVLLTGRAVQGVGLGGTAAVSIAAVALLVPQRERGRVNGSLQALQTSATILGPIVGGVVVQSLGWRWCFVVALPLAVASFAVLTATLHVRLPVAARGGRTDYAGALLIATGIPSALIALTLVGEGATGVAFTAFGSFGLLALIALVIVELRVAAPIIPLRLLASRVPLVCAVAAVLLGSTLFGGSVFVTQYLQIGLGIDPAPAGLLLAPMAVGAVIASFAAGRAITRRGRVKGVLLLAAAAMLVGNAALALAPLAPLPLALTGALLLSAGLGMSLQNLVLAAQTVAPPGRTGSVSAAIVFFFTLGGTVGLVGYGAALSARIGVLTQAGATEAEAYALGLPLVFALSAAAAAVALGALVMLPTVRLRNGA